MEWLVIKTDRDMKISTQKVIANELNEALNKAEEESNWEDNEGLPYGIYYYFDREADPLDIECEWFKTEQERDKVFEEKS